MTDNNVWAQWNTLLDQAMSKTTDANFLSALKSFKNTYILPKLGNNDIQATNFDWGALKSSANSLQNGSYVFDILTKLGIAKNPFDISVRSWLESRPQLKSLGDVKVTWDPKTRSILLNGKPFLTQQDFAISNGHALSNTDILNKALINYLKGSMAGMPGDNNKVDGAPDNGSGTKNPVADMSDSDLEIKMKELELSGQLDSYKKALDIVGKDNDAIAAKIKDTFTNLTQSALADLEESYNANKAALESEKGEVEAHYAGAQQQIEQAVAKAKTMSKEDMAARGIYFSGLMSKALSTIEAQGILEKSKVAAAKAADLNKIASQIAVLTTNYNIGKNKVKDYYAAQEGLKLLDLMQNSAKEKEKIQLLMSGIQSQIDTLNKEKPYLKEQMDRQQKAAAAQQEFKNWKDVNNINLQWAKLTEGQRQFDLGFTEKQREFAAKYGLDLAKLDEQKREFNKEMDATNRKLDIQEAFNNAKIALERFAQQHRGSAQAKTAEDLANTPLSTLISSGATGLMKYISSLENLKVKADPLDKYSKTDWPSDIAPVMRKQEVLATTLLGLTTDSTNLNDPRKLQAYKNDLRSLVDLQPSDINSVIDNFVQDPIGKIYGSLFLYNGGDPVRMKKAFYDNVEQFDALFKKYGIDTPEYRSIFYKLLGIGGGHH